MKKLSLILVLSLFGVLGMQAQALNSYFYIKNNATNNYVQVKGRLTAAPDATAPQTLPGCVIKVVTDANGKVTVLRSQAVDVPNAIGRAMKYIPEIVELLVAKLAVEGSGDDYILGTTGVDAIMEKFNENIDANFYVEEVSGSYRIYAKTPSMAPVKEFYLENKAKVDSKLMNPGLEETINKILLKVINKVKGTNSTTIAPKWEFNVQRIWGLMNEPSLVEPVDDASKLLFYQTILQDEALIWKFAQTTAIYYLNAVETSETFETLSGDASFAEYMKYWGMVKKIVNQIRPDFKYYVVANGNDFTFVSEGNRAIKNNEANTLWTLEDIANDPFVLKLNSSLEQDGYYYGTQYVDFGYQLPANCNAYTISEITPEGFAIASLIGNVVPAQTPVLIESTGTTVNIRPVDNNGSVGTNLLVGNDFLVERYQIKNETVAMLFLMAQMVAGNNFDKYDYLALKTAGTVKNKFFFTLTEDELVNNQYNEEFSDGMVRAFNKGTQGANAGLLGFFVYRGGLPGNKAFLYDPAYEHPASKGANLLSFDGDATGIKELNTKVNTNAQMYDLSGRKVNKSFNGVVIVNGKKVVLK